MRICVSIRPKMICVWGRFYPLLQMNSKSGQLWIRWWSMCWRQSKCASKLRSVWMLRRSRSKRQSHRPPWKRSLWFSHGRSMHMLLTGWHGIHCWKQTARCERRFVECQSQRIHCAGDSRRNISGTFSHSQHNYSLPTIYQLNLFLFCSAENIYFSVDNFNDTKIFNSSNSSFFALICLCFSWWHSSMNKNKKDHSELVFGIHCIAGEINTCDLVRVGRDVTQRFFFGMSRIN